MAEKFEDRERAAKGCTHPEDEPCFGVGPDPFNVRHDPPRQVFDTPEVRDALTERVGNVAPPPSHYEGTGGLDPWAYIEAHGLDYWAGNVIKYVTRAGRKEIATVEEDLIKARNYIDYMIDRERRGE